MPATSRHRIARCSCVLAAAVSLGGCTQEALEPKVVPGNQSYVEGALAYQEGDRERALAALQAALQTNPDLIMARFLMGNIYRDKGDFASAADQYKKVVELDPYVYSNHYNLGLMYHLLSRLQEAAASYLEAVRLNPQDLKSNMYLGMVYTALGKPDVGLPYVQKATEIDPRSGEAWANLGVVLDSLQQYTAAENAYRKAIELDPDRIDAMTNLAGCMVAQKRYREASNIYEQVLKTRDTSLLRQRYGYALLQAGQYEPAIAQFSLAIKQNAANYHAYNGLGDAMLALYRQSAMLDERKRADALKYWRKSLEINAQQPRVATLVKEYSESSLVP
jgi:tetratricopeptide (TPR) repeat protein